MTAASPDNAVFSAPYTLPSNSYALEKFKLYQTQTKFYLVGRDKSKMRWRILKIDRSEPSKLDIYEDPTVYTKEECVKLLRRLSGGNRLNGGVNLVTKAYGIVGFIKFLEPYYMILITKRHLLGTIQGHSIYGISESQLITVPHPAVLTKPAHSDAENRYKKLFNSVDLSKDFFYSYTYRIMWSLQKNLTAGETAPMPFDDMFVWNSFLTREFRNELKSIHWTVALVYGYFKQVKLVCEGTNFMLTLIARRSRHFAGTRYFKRGINVRGRVANDVETEQVIYEEKKNEISSVVQHRGSIPLYWSQEASIFSPKPDILLHKSDTTYEATRRHFQNLVERYGNPIFVLNLAKTVERRPRESVLSREFANAVAYLNHELPKSERIKFIQWDIHLFSKRKYPDVLEVLQSIAFNALDAIGFYYSGTSINQNDQTTFFGDAPKGQADNDQSDNKQRLQHGILRTNCIDCVDRTNVAQYAFGLAGLGRQMNALGLHNTHLVSSRSSLAIKLMEMYEDMGDVLALQYGGSPAHNKVFSQWQGKWNATIQSQEFFRSIVRHYNNAYLDGEKQDAINIFLGHFAPQEGKLALWQLESNNQLEIRRTGDDPMNDLRLSFKRSLSVGSMQKSSDGDSQIVEPISMKRPALDMSKRGITISEAELKKCLDEASGLENLSIVRREQSLHVSPQKSADNVQVLGESVDADWSSTNSIEDEIQERFFVSATGASPWKESEITPHSQVELDTDNYDQDDYFQDLTSLLMKAKSYKWVSNSGSESAEVDEASIVKADTGYSDGFIKWIEDEETVCF